MIIPLQIKRNFFNETAFLFSCHALWKLLYFGNKTSYGNGNLYKDLLLVYLQIRIRKTSLFWLYNLMTSLWKPSTTTFSRDMEIVSMQSYRAISSWMNTWCINNSDQLITNQWRKRKKTGIDLPLPLQTNQSEQNYQENSGRTAHPVRPFHEGVDHMTKVHRMLGMRDPWSSRDLMQKFAATFNRKH